MDVGSAQAVHRQCGTAALRRVACVRVFAHAQVQRDGLRGQCARGVRCWVLGTHSLAPGGSSTRLCAALADAARHAVADDPDADHLCIAVCVLRAAGSPWRHRP